MKKFLITVLLAVMGVFQLSAQINKTTDDNDDLLFGDTEEVKDAEIAKIAKTSPDKKGVKISAGYLFMNSYSVGEKKGLSAKDVKELYKLNGNGFMVSLSKSSEIGTGSVGLETAVDLKFGKGDITEEQEDCPTSCTNIALTGSLGFSLSANENRFQFIIAPLCFGYGYMDAMPNDRKHHFIFEPKLKMQYFLTNKIGISVGGGYGISIPSDKKGKEPEYSYANMSLYAALVYSL